MVREAMVNAVVEGFFKTIDFVGRFRNNGQVVKERLRTDSQNRRWGKAANMLVVNYNPALVVAAILVAVMASFTGLRLASGLSQLAPARRKGHVVMAAVALGGGIWSTHFVAMLALRLPVPVFYDALTTLVSALIAILLTGGALLLLHFGRRTTRRVVGAGVLMGAGIVTMHYTGMAGIEGCGTVFGVSGYVVSTLLAIGLRGGPRISDHGIEWIAS